MCSVSFSIDTSSHNQLINSREWVCHLCHLWSMVSYAFLWRLSFNPFLVYLSFFWIISLLLFHKLMAFGEACGLQSNVTSLPARTFNMLLRLLSEKLGGDAAEGEKKNLACWKHLMPYRMKNSEQQKLNSLQSLAKTGSLLFRSSEI